MTPNDQMSTLVVYDSPRKISGATYPGVPQAVNITLASPMTLPSPKSTILIGESGSWEVYMRFSGLRSRCAMPSKWAWCIPAAIWRTASAASFSVYFSLVTTLRGQCGGGAGGLGRARQRRRGFATTTTLGCKQQLPFSDMGSARLAHRSNRSWPRRISMTM